MPFAYYARLTKADKRIYDASDAISELSIPGVEKLSPLADAIGVALATGQRAAVQKASQAFARALTRSLETERVVVRVLATRPSSDDSELHGLYVREEGEPAIIRVWMRTAAKKAVVKPRTFIRTLVHELVHHLDYTHLELEDSFHTEGFYRRESRLVRQVLGDPARPPPPRAAPAAPPRSAPARAPRARPEQLELFGEASPARGGRSSGA